MFSEELKKKASEKFAVRRIKFEKEIAYSAQHSLVYGGDVSDDYIPKCPRHEHTEVSVVDNDIQSWLYDSVRVLTGKTAVLNFADFVKPGGMYLKGSTAQEEAICHCTTLFETQKLRYTYYMYNENHKNGGLYTNRMLYSPDILVLDEKNEIVGKIDVITCAAPNMSPGLRYKSITVKEGQEVFEDRIDFMFRYAAKNEVDTLVLGAWGCGIFKNDPYFVAKMMRSTQKIYDGYFRDVVYVIPSGKSFDIFDKENREI